MNVENLRALQEPLKAAYRQEPASAIVILRANAVALDGVACRLDTGRALVEAGLHPAAGGDGSQACSGDMLLQALVACAGVTLSAIANSLGVRLRKAEVFAEGELDFRGTLAVARDAPVGFRALRLRFAIDTEADQSTLAKIVELTERYCVVLRTLQASPPIAVTYNRIEDSLTS